MPYVILATHAIIVLMRFQQCATLPRSPASWNVIARQTVVLRRHSGSGAGRSTLHRIGADRIRDALAMVTLIHHAAVSSTQHQQCINTSTQADCKMKSKSKTEVEVEKSKPNQRDALDPPPSWVLPCSGLYAGNARPRLLRTFAAKELVVAVTGRGTSTSQSLSQLGSYEPQISGIHLSGGS
jgi:hypothetical protein